MPPLLQRRCKLILHDPNPVVGVFGQDWNDSVQTSVAREFADFRVQFKIEKTITKQPNTAEIQVYNLAPNTRAALQGRGTQVQLFAGYGGSLALLFSGDSRTIDHVRDGADWLTKIQCGDGERRYRFALISESFQPGKQIKDAALAAVKALTSDSGNAEQKLGSVFGQYVSGFTMHGKAATELENILKSQGLEWSLQDGRMQILAPGDVTDDSPLLVNAQSGLIGSPEHGSPEMLGGPGVLKVKMLLQPLAHPGRAMVVQSQNIKNGRFRIEKVTHTGDTSANEWYTTIEGRQLAT